MLSSITKFFSLFYTKTTNYFSDLLSNKKEPTLKIENKIDIKNMRLQKLHYKNKNKTFSIHAYSMKTYIEDLNEIKKQLTLLKKEDWVKLTYLQRDLSTFNLEDLFVIKNKNKSIFTNDLIIVEFLGLRKDILFLVHQKITLDNSAYSDVNRRLLKYVLKDIDTLYSYLSDLEV